MKKSKFTESQILETLQEAESGVLVADVRRKRGISVATFYQWKRKYVRMTVPELKRVKGLEARMPGSRHVCGLGAGERCHQRGAVSKVVDADRGGAQHGLVAGFHT